MLDAAEAGDHIVFYSIDRFARNSRDFANTMWELERKKIRVHFIQEQINTDTAIGKLQASMRAAAAQFMSDLLSERLREANAIRKMREGKKVERRKGKWIASGFTSNAQKELKLSRPVGRIFRYHRVSSERQYTSGLGLSYQIEATRREAERLQKEIGGKVYDEVFDDNAISAFRIPFDERPAAKRLLTLLEPGDDIIIYRLDRAWRSPVDAIKTMDLLASKGVYIHLVNEGIRSDTRQGTEWISLLSSMAHMESVLKSERTREAMVACKLSGRPVSLHHAGFTEREVKPGVKKLVFSDAQAAHYAEAWILKHETTLTRGQQESILLALRHWKIEKPPNLGNIVRVNVPRMVEAAEGMREKISDTLWQRTLSQARHNLRSIPNKYFYRPNPVQKEEIDLTLASL